jgi:hypothetical protein
LDPDDPEAHHSYIELMKRRITNLESRLKQMSQTSSISPQSSVPIEAGSTRGDQAISPLLDADGDANASSQNQPRRHDALQTEIGFLSLAAMAGFTGEQISSTATISFQQLAQAVTCISGSNALRSEEQNEAIRGSLGHFHRNVLRQGFGLAAVDAMKPLNNFMPLVHVSLPILNVDELQRDYEKMLQREQCGETGDMFIETPMRTIRLYLAVSVGLMMGRDHRHTENFATLFILNAYQFLPRAFAQASDSEAAQCLVLMAILSIYSPFGGSAWHLFGLAMTRCISAGLHTSRMSDHRSEDEGRKKNSSLFWTLYCFDA